MKSVYLSGSNQFDNVGVGEYGTEAYRMSLITDNIQKILQSRGVLVYRSENTWTLSKIVKDSNSKNIDVHIAIHSNANTGDDRGCEVYCHMFGGEGEKLSRAIYGQLEPLTPTKDRGVKVGKDFYGKGKSMYELESTNAPASLVEIAFHDNKDDANFIVNQMNEISNNIAVGILYYLDVPLTDPVIEKVEARIFNDHDEISEWSRDYVNHLCGNKIIVGDENGNFNPKNTATREEVAVMLSKVLKMFGK
jgi:N-acetylmuramoyl-L-alanine amidase